jgi:hypothetical protein
VPAQRHPLPQAGGIDDELSSWNIALEKRRVTPVSAVEMNTVNSIEVNRIDRSAMRVLTMSQAQKAATSGRISSRHIVVAPDPGAPAQFALTARRDDDRASSG